MAALHSAFADEHTALQNREVVFKPFTWHHNPQRGVPVSVDSGRVAEFAGSVRDVVPGVRNLLQMIERDAIEGDCASDSGAAVPAILGVQEAANFKRLCVWALGHLAAEAESMSDYMESIAQQQAAR